MLGEFRLANLVMRRRVNIWACGPQWSLLPLSSSDVVGRARAAAENRWRMACPCSNKTLFTKQAELAICPIVYCLSPKVPLAESSHSLSCYNFHTGFHARTRALVRPATAQLPEMFKKQMLGCTLCPSGWWWGSSHRCFIQALQMVQLHSQGEVHWW